MWGSFFFSPVPIPKNSCTFVLQCKQRVEAICCRSFLSPHPRILTQSLILQFPRYSIRENALSHMFPYSTLLIEQRPTAGIIFQCNGVSLWPFPIGLSSLFIALPKSPERCWTMPDSLRVKLIVGQQRLMNDLNPGCPGAPQTRETLVCVTRGVSRYPPSRLSDQFISPCRMGPSVLCYSCCACVPFEDLPEEPRTPLHVLRRPITTKSPPNRKDEKNFIENTKTNLD